MQKALTAVSYHWMEVRLENTPNCNASWNKWQKDDRDN